MMLVLALAAVASAASPNPDRPSVSRSGFLVSPDTLELELGAQWAAARSVPTTLKYSIAGKVEPRASANLAGMESGAPALEAGLKVALVDKEWGLALFGGSAVPVSASEPYGATLQGLLTAPLGGPVGLQVNSGVDVGGNGQGGLQLAGVPLVGAVTLAPLDRLSLFAELAGHVIAPGCDGAQCVFGQVIVDGGVGVLLTEILVVDVGAGWDLGNQQPYATVGLAANFGHI